MNTKLIAAMIAMTCGAATAGTIQIGGQAAGADGKISNQPGVCTVTFNSGDAANTCGATYAASSGTLAASHFRTGSNEGTYASPAGDSTAYLTVGPTDGTPVSVTLAAQANYFGFYAGSLDSFNLVRFFLNGTQVDSFTGTQINAVAFPGNATTGDRAAAQFIDYFPGTFFNGLVISSSQNAFETDSHAFGIAAPRAVPEPTSIALLGLGTVALFARRRKVGADSKNRMP